MLEVLFYVMFTFIGAFEELPTNVQAFANSTTVDILQCSRPANSHSSANVPHLTSNFELKHHTTSPLTPLLQSQLPAPTNLIATPL